MKKRYILNIEFEAEIREVISKGKKRRYKNFNKLLKALLMSDQSIFDIYNNLIISDLLHGDHVFTIEKEDNILQVKDEDEVIKQVIELLPENNKRHFLEILDSNDKRTDEFMEDFFDQFGDLKVKNVNFIEKNM